MFIVHRAERADALVRGLGDVLTTPLPDPMQEEVVAVHTRGMERWLSQRLSERLGAIEGGDNGVCANVSFPFPHRLARDAIAAASGINGEQDPWLPERSVWSLLEIVDRNWEEEWLSYLVTYVKGFDADSSTPAGGRRMAAAQKMARLFDRYALLRPAMVRDWAQGDPTDGVGNSLDSEFAWQAELWQRLRTNLSQASPAERLEKGCQRLREEPTVVDLPDRISLFGLTRLPAGHMQVLQALAAERDVHLFALHPSPTLWKRVAEQPPFFGFRAEDPTSSLPKNPLLRSWGKDARELQLILAESDDVAEQHHTREVAQTSLLRQLQADVAADRQPPGMPVQGADDARVMLADDDLSIQVHSCHGKARQVEILREAILHTLAADPTIEPRDVIVMCPDIETYAPLIKATFGSAEPTSGGTLAANGSRDASPRLRVRLADRSLRQSNPVLGIVDLILRLASGRMTASQVLDLADADPVRRRFGFDDDDLTQIEAWVSSAGIHWGFDAEHRASFQMSAVEAGTWRKGLDRILVGVVMSEDGLQLFEEVLPLDDVPSGAIDLVGRFVEFVERLEKATDRLATPKPLAGWVSAIGEIADEMTATSSRESWQRSELSSLLEGVADEANVEGASRRDDLNLQEVRMLLDERLLGSPTWTNFRTGHLTICTLMPMRSVPHRVVCLLGLDDGTFPRHGSPDGDDLSLREPLIGERDPRMEDRQLLLDAVMSATDRLIITFSGADERSNLPRPPAVPIAEFIDIIDRTARCGDGNAVDRVLVRHPLQPFDPRNFVPGRPLETGSWAFSQFDLEGAKASLGERDSRPTFLSEPLDNAPGSVVELDDLVRFVEHPVRAFLRQQLGVSTFRSNEQVGDGLPIELDGLQAWGVGQRMLEARLRGCGIDEARRAEVARGELPPGNLAAPTLDRISATVEELFGAIRSLAGWDTDATSLDIRVPLSDGRLLSGTVPGIRNDVLRVATYSRVGPKHRLASWVRFLAASAAYPEQPVEAVVIGRVRSGGRGRVTTATLDSFDSASRRETAISALDLLLDLYDRGMGEPLPIACATSAAFASARRSGGDAEKAAAAEWQSEFDFDKEDRDETHRLVWNGILPFRDLIASVPIEGEEWGLSEATRFGNCAVRLWGDLLAHERIEDH